MCATNGGATARSLDNQGYTRAGSRPDQTVSVNNNCMYEITTASVKLQQDGSDYNCIGQITTVPCCFVYLMNA